MADRPVLIIHGYSDRGESLRRWRDALRAEGFSPDAISLTEYESLSNEITIKDIAEGLDRAVRARLGDHQAFDAIVHSTGMLVIREWLTTYARRRDRLKHLVALAPATFGSPLAHKGRGWLGGIFKGRTDFQHPDFLEAGDQVLTSLELGSRYTWDLALKDLCCERPVYGPGADTPYPFVIVGVERYGFLTNLATRPGDGTDGTVRWAGTAMDSRKFELDLTRDPQREGPRIVVLPERGRRLPMPSVLLSGYNHSSILREPGNDLVGLVSSALRVEDEGAYLRWHEEAAVRTRQAFDGADEREWQQLVVRVVDERGDPIPDWFIELGRLDGNGEFTSLDDFDLEVHAFHDDQSLRAFHLDLTRLGRDAKPLQVRLIASSGTQLVAYHGVGSDYFDAEGRLKNDATARWDATFEIPPVSGDGVRFFWPFTTTLVEVRLNREPLPLGGEPNRMFRFWEDAGAG